MADSKPKDPTVSSASMSSGDATEGWHPARPVSETTHGKPSQYKDNPDKPDPTTIAQVEIVPDEKAR